MKALLIALFGFCPTEDSSNCFWDESLLGNREGIAFLHIGTEETYMLITWPTE